MKKKIFAAVLILSFALLLALFYKNKGVNKHKIPARSLENSGESGITVLNVILNEASGIYTGAAVFVDFEKKGEVKGIDIFQSKVNIKIVFSEKIKITEDFSFNIKTDEGLKIEIKNSSNEIFLSQNASVEVIDSGWLKRYRAGQMMR